MTTKKEKEKKIKGKKVARETKVWWGPNKERKRDLSVIKKEIVIVLGKNRLGRERGGEWVINDVLLNWIRISNIKREFKIMGWSKSIEADFNLKSTSFMYNNSI